MKVKEGSFGWALEMLKQGHRLQREGWNGKGMFVCHMPGMVLQDHEINDRTRHHLPAHLGPLQVGGYFAIWTAQKTWQPGWKPTYLDMFGEDWQIVESFDFPICK